MRLVLVLIAALACAAAPAAAGTETGAQRKYVARYCSPTGDLCYGIVRSGGIIFELRTIEQYFKTYTICVGSPRGSRTCRTMAITQRGRIYASYRAWPRGFGDSTPGVYRVTWKQGGRALGPTLRFRHR